MPYVNTNRTYVQLSDEDVWGDEGGGTPNTDLIPVMDGDYGVALDDPIREQQHVLGNLNSKINVQDVRNLAGPFRVGLWPHNWERMLDWATTRTAGESSSKAAHYVVPGIETRLHAGLKVDSLTIEGSEGGDVTASLDLRGRHENTDTEPTYPGALTVPDIPSLLFKNARFIISLDAGTTFANKIIPTGLRQFSINVNNNHKVGRATENRIDGYLDGIPEFLTAGRQDSDVRFTAAFDSADYGALQRNRLFAQFKMVAAHPNYTTYFTVDTLGAVAGASVAVPVTADPTTDVAVGDYVLFDNYGGTELPCVGEVESVTAVEITIVTLDEDVVAGDHIFLAGIEIKTGRMLVSATPLTKPFDDFLTVEVSAMPTGANQITWKAKDMTLPA